MLFGSLEFWLVLPITIVLYYLIPARLRWVVLLLFSIGYLGYLSISFLIYALTFASLNYGFGIILSRSSQPYTRKFLYNIFLIINIGQLVFYKYLDFIIENLNLLANLANAKEIPYLDILVPIGISYYTFQCIGYLINIYRKVERPETHYGYFLIYNIFFPKILSGPIERSEKFLPQIRNPLSPSAELFKEGLYRLLMGIFKKLIIAERLSVIVFNTYPNIENFTGFALLEIMFIQAIYIYTDFSGYTDIALGMASFFGIKLTDNFNRPFFATTVTNFWRRWHISLSLWCNDYIFKSIIFRRRRWGTTASVYGVFITFLIIGLWHGPLWTFVILGILQGLAINYEFFTKKARLRIGNKIHLFWNNMVSRMITYAFFSFSLIFFFAESLEDSLYFVVHLFIFENSSISGNNLGLERRNVLIVVIAAIVLFVIEALEERGYKVFDKVKLLPAWSRWIVYYLIVVIIFVFGKFATTNFVYFQF